MAHQITHIGLAEKVFDTHFAHYDKADFMCGTVFPDIRYPAGLHRDATHRYDVTLADVLAEKNSFRAGMVFHSLVDGASSQFGEQPGGLYDLFGGVSMPVRHASKVAEDKLTYPRLQGLWAQVPGWLDHVRPEEQEFGVPNSDLERWHETVVRYTAQPPSLASRTEFFHRFGFPPDEIEGIMVLTERIERSVEAQTLMNKFWQDFEGFLE